MPSPTQPPAPGPARRRLIAAAAAAGLITGAITAIQTPANAEGPGAPPKAAAESRHTITLITGDVVTVNTSVAGAETVDVDRPDDAVGAVRLQKSGGDLFVVPDEVLPLLSGDK